MQTHSQSKIYASFVPQFTAHAMEWRICVFFVYLLYAGVLAITRALTMNSMAREKFRP